MPETHPTTTTPKLPRRDYFAKRAERLIPMVPDSGDEKALLVSAAKADGGRSLNSWMLLYVLPYAVEVARRQLVAEARKKGTKLHAVHSG
jgi:uncharacterized protein (DUF1778 family)